ncbi:MarR family winged helix-turn-helix transcriptional regulator [Leifsonia sp. NPDC058248]|uniref:MarR family winged helix-turn-helix transcriptional regulator n=1 Tax=Leifsonia sp. NPDC058248 TaxID=3346402 RepID=UPI0036D96784
MNAASRDTSIARVQEELTTIARRGTARVRRENEALSFVDQSLLSYIAANPGCRAVEIAAHFRLNRSTVSRQLGALAEFGLIATADAGAPGRGRGQALHLTAAGESAMRDSSDTVLAALTERLSGWAASDIENFARMLERYNDIGDD